MILVCIVIEPSTRSIAPIRELFRNLVVDLRIQTREALRTAPIDGPSPDLLLICESDGPTAIATLEQISRSPALQHIPRWVACSQHDRDFCDVCFTLGASDVLHFPLLQSELQPKMLSLQSAHAHAQIQHQLKTREATLKEALDTGKMAYWEVDLETLTCTFNDAFYRLLRVDAASVGGYKLSTHDYANRFLHPEDRHLIADYVDISRRNPELMVFHELSYRFIHGDGTPGTMFLRYSLRRDDGVLKAFGISRDVTEETDREKLTRDYKRRLEATQAGIDAAIFGIYQVNENGYVRYANDQASQMTGFSREELLSMHVTEIDANLDLDSWQQHRRITHREGGRILETRHRRKDGSLLDVEVTVHPYFYEGKRSTFSFVRDLTERNRQRLRLAESQQRFDSVLMSVSSLGVMGFDQDLRVFFWNPANEQVYGYRSEEAIGKNVVDLIVPEDQRTHAIEILEEAFRSGKPPEASEASLQRKDGRTVTVFSNRALVHADGRAELYCIDLDLSEAKAVEIEKERVFQDMLEAKELAERANRSKDEFLAVMSHEMRTPLNPILGFSNILRKECTPEQNEYITIIYESAERLRNLISEILDYIRLGKGDIQPKMAAFNLLELCQTSFLDARQQSQSKGLQLSFNNGFEHYQTISGSCSVQSDSHMLLRILDNLLINACKYTPAGRIDLNIGITSIAPASSQARFVASVVDTGIGIDASALKGIFDPFTQADSSYTRKSEGVGLGLSICKKLIDLLGGSIEVESLPNRGSTFRINIPVEILPTPETGPSDTPAFQWHQFAWKPKILIVDDTPNNAKIAGIMIGKMGCTSTTASDGKAAIAQCETEPFDLILMDLSMPVMDGLVATRALRSNAGPNQHTPVLGLSAHVSQSVREQCKQAGMDGYLEKPIHAAELQDAIVSILKHARSPKPPAT